MAFMAAANHPPAFLAKPDEFLSTAFKFYAENLMVS
jgi:hypothetical protein